MAYTPEQRAEALDVYATEGLAAAAKHAGCAKATVLNWAEAAGVQPPERSEQTKAATAAHVEKMAAERRQARQELAQTARNLLSRIREEESPTKCQALAVSAAILVDKWQVIGWGDGEVDTSTGNADLDRLREEGRQRGQHLVAV